VGRTPHPGADPRPGACLQRRTPPVNLSRRNTAKDPVKTSIRYVIDNTSVYGKDSTQAKAIAKDDTTARTLKAGGVDLDKLQAVRQGVISAMRTPNSTLDFSGGATTWHGRDFSQSNKPANESYYQKGFKFTDPSHDIWAMGTKSKSTSVEIKTGKTKEVFSFDFKYESTAAFGDTLFMKRTRESFAAGYPDTIGKALLRVEKLKSENAVLVFKAFGLGMIGSSSQALTDQFNKDVEQHKKNQAEIDAAEAGIDRVLEKHVRFKARF